MSDSNNDTKVFRRKNRSYTCGRCHLHGHSVLIKDHQLNCPYISCTCRQCQCLLEYRLSVKKRKQTKLASVHKQMTAKFSSRNPQFSFSSEEANEKNGINQINSSVQPSTSVPLPSTQLTLPDALKTTDTSYPLGSSWTTNLSLSCGPQMYSDLSILNCSQCYALALQLVHFSASSSSDHVLLARGLLEFTAERYGI
ncbi:hypothetical protein M3Y96_00569300 [Aphelenchoides besseyi]|nr:hypothetical protein M3Y96_00569300 [Aphelenchoides besseyi]